MNEMKFILLYAAHMTRTSLEANTAQVLDTNHVRAALLNILKNREYLVPRGYFSACLKSSTSSNNSNHNVI